MNDGELEELISLLFATRRLIRSRVGARGRAADPYAWLRLEVLRFIAEEKGASMRDLAAYLSVTAPSASSLIARLETDGYVRRQTGKDRRAVLLYPTAKGARELARAQKENAKALKAVFSPLTRAELSALLKLLRRVSRK